jgi:ribosomal protein L11 methyltransferase
MLWSLRLTAPAQLEDLLESLLWALGAQSISLSAPTTLPRQLEALFDQDCRQKVEEVLAEHLAKGEQAGESPAFAWEELGPRDWLEHVRASFHPVRAGRFHIVAEWDEQPPDPFLIRIRPGQAFGTGHHETTRMALESLSALDLTGQRVLDVGCGTGILAIAAERLGASFVLGVDNDADCRDNMMEHLELNHSERVCLTIGTLEEAGEGDFDLVLANITLNVLQHTWPSLPALLKPGGRLITTGLLLEQEAFASQCLELCGFRLWGRRQQGEWLLLEALAPC